MSDYVPQVGDRVRVVLEGEVLAREPGPSIVVSAEYDREHEIWYERNDVSVEKVAPPLPTAYGSVIRYRGAVGSASHTGYYTLGPKGWKRYGHLDPVAASSLGGNEYEVLFDAGKDA